MNRAGAEKSAIFLLSLGEETAAQVFRYLTPAEVNEIGQVMRGLSALPRERVESVLREYAEMASRQTGFAADPEGFLDATLARALGGERGRQMMKRILGEEISGLKQLEWMEPESVAALLGSEPPQVIAAMLVYLDRKQASHVLEWLDEPLRHEVIQCVAGWRGVPAEVLRELNGWIASRLRVQEEQDSGESLAAELLEGLTPAARAQAESGLAEAAPELLEQMKTRRLGMEDLLRLTDVSRNRFFKAVPGQALLTALKGVNPELVNALLAQLPDSAARRLGEDIDALGAIRVDEIESAQNAVVELLKKMAVQGELEFGP